MMSSHLKDWSSDGIKWQCFSHIRYLGQAEVGDKNRHTLVRACYDVACSNNVREFLNELGFKSVAVDMCLYVYNLKKIMTNLAMCITMLYHG